MSTLILYAKRQMEATIYCKNRRTALLVAMLALFVTGLVLLFQTPGFSVQYDGTRVPVITPLTPDVCIGDTLRFSVTVTIAKSEIPGQLQIAEAWCKEGFNGSCVGVIPPRPNLPLLQPKRIVTTSVRVVPDTVAPGVVYLWHSATNSHGQVSGYIVGPITVKECEVPK